jgi:hypothetical protein
MAIILARKLGPDGSPMRGNGLENFAADLEATAIILSENLQFLQGSWWMNLSEGLPLFQKLLGHPTTSQAVALIIRNTILASPYVTGIVSMSVVYNPSGRGYTFTATVQTAFGQISLSNVPVAATS